MSASAPTRIDPRTEMGAVSLRVHDLARSRAFYEQVTGLEAGEAPDGRLAFGAPAQPPLLYLSGDPAAPARPRRTTGLFHFALLLPSRRDLALALLRLARARWPLDGASDHLVSEALYLSDPDGNGIEIYRDRPRSEWTHDGEQIRMATLPLDLESLLAEVGDGTEPPERMPAELRMGHVHLSVGDLAETDDFYAGVLGFDVTTREYPGALFLSAGGYHHHLGTNVWRSAGAPPSPAGSLGLVSYEIRLPDAEALGHVTARAREAGLTGEPAKGATILRDPSGIEVVLRAA